MIAEVVRTIEDVVAEVRELPPSRERSLAITNLEQAAMWLVRGGDA